MIIAVIPTKQSYYSQQRTRSRKQSCHSQQRTRSRKQSCPSQQRTWSRKQSCHSQQRTRSRKQSCHSQQRAQKPCQTAAAWQQHSWLWQETSCCSTDELHDWSERIYHHSRTWRMYYVVIANELRTSHTFIAFFLFSGTDKRITERPHSLFNCANWIVILPLIFKLNTWYLTHNSYSKI